jgi:hypothetical protein
MKKIFCYVSCTILGILMVSCGGTQKPAGHECVDLGLSVKWATCNVGANNPEDTGDCFAWGEVVPKVSSFEWKTYKFFDRDREMLTKYCTRGDYGSVDNKNCLELKDDAANFCWGDKWRIPTSTEIEELIGRCTWEGTSLNGVDGCKITGPNGNSIFLPYGGLKDEYEISKPEFGWYWSSSLKDECFAAWILVVGGENGEKTQGLCTPTHRSYGLRIRPVYPN